MKKYSAAESSGLGRKEEEMNKKIKGEKVSYPSSFGGMEGEEIWLQGTCPICGAQCAIFLYDSSVPGAECPKDFYLSLTDGAECCEHLEAVQDGCLVFTATGRAEVLPYERY